VEINKDSEIPIYQQLKNYIQLEIAKGNLKPGSRVESETEISEKFKISRITIRKAYGELVDEGYFVRKRGKGTYLRDIRYRESLSSSNSFTKCCQSLGMVPGTNIVSIGREKVNAKVASALRVEEGTELAYAERLRFADGIPVRFERNFYSEKFADIIRENLEGSIYSLLRTKFGITETKQMNFVIEIGYTDKRESALLGTKLHSPTLKVNGTLYDGVGEPIYHTEMLHLPDRCVLVV
jgi:GntR family transcriptional regulator